MKKLDVIDLIEASVKDGRDDSKAFDYAMIAKHCIIEAWKLHLDKPSSHEELLTNMTLQQEMQDIQKMLSLYLTVHSGTDENSGIER